MGKNRQFLSKHVRNEVGSFVEPEGDQFLADFSRANRDTSPSEDLTCEGAQVRLVRSRGGNTMECESADGNSSLYWLPAKFSKVVWAQRGDYLIVEPERTKDEAGGRDSKVTGTIVHILFPEQVAHLKKLACWPEGFSSDTKKSEEGVMDHCRRETSGSKLDETAEEDSANSCSFETSNDSEIPRACGGAGCVERRALAVEGGRDGERGSERERDGGVTSSESEEEDDDDLFVNNNRNHDDLINNSDDE